MSRLLLPFFTASLVLFAGQHEAKPRKTCCSNACCKPDRNCDRHCDKACEKAGCPNCCDKPAHLQPAPTEPRKP
ncbi:hypothetical protein [Mesoterricola sediminis]|uniref:Uncharacterized protein n=1 Tax=Mesoterricola sediminis TaxID=2927980 RepID=A0AA48H6K2_9BACT|nr:hypothetical protein [Mesoterricola sediminis]BDU78301.1 hypothetical protein METESE_32590 [Mesoterricola sediminis]